MSFAILLWTGKRFRSGLDHLSNTSPMSYDHLDVPFRRIGDHDTLPNASGTVIYSHSNTENYEDAENLTRSNYALSSNIAIRLLFTKAHSHIINFKYLDYVNVKVIDTVQCHGSNTVRDACIIECMLGLNYRVTNLRT